MGVVVISLFCYSANEYSAQLMNAYDRREHWYISVYAKVCTCVCVFAEREILSDFFLVSFDKTSSRLCYPISSIMRARVSNAQFHCCMKRLDNV